MMTRRLLPGIADPDFVLHGGLAGGIWLESRPACGLEVTAVHVRDPMGAQPSVQVSCMLRGRAPEGRRCHCEAQVRILDPSGKLVTSTSMLKCRQQCASDAAPLHAQLVVLNPRRWSLESREQYTVEVELRCEGKVVDTARRRFGIRLAEFCPAEGFLLNGARVALRGCNRHESIPGFGNALPNALQRRDAELIARMGLNFVRLSHYPQSPLFLDACDELGILVYAELASWKSVRTGRWLENAERQLRDMIARDHHHPSVVLWGLGNEARDARAYRQLREVAYASDPEQRPVIYAENHLYRARRHKTIGVTDVWGANYETEALKEGIQGSRLRVGLLSECANIPHARRGQTAFELEQLGALHQAITASEEVGPACAGYAIWSFNDYATLRKNRVRRECGLLDATRVPKLSSEWLAARLTSRTILSVRVDWSAHGAEQRRVTIVTNAEPQPIVQGETLTSFEDSDIPCVYTADVAFAEQPLDIEVRAARQKITRRIEPWGAAAQVGAVSDGYAKYGDDVIAFDLEIQDAKGNHVRLFEGEGTVCNATGIDLACIGGSRVLFRGGLGRFYGRRLNDQALTIEVSCGKLDPWLFNEEASDLE